MVSIITESSITLESSYPKLMVNHEENIIVLFWEEEKGIVVYTKNLDYNLGEYRIDWDSDNFYNWYGTIEFSQGRDE
jgi:hypothetical protein